MTSISIYQTVDTIKLEMPQQDVVRMTLQRESLNNDDVHSIYESDTTVIGLRWLVDEICNVVNDSEYDVIIAFTLPGFNQTLNEFNTGRARTLRSKCFRAINEYVTMGRLVVS